MIQHGAADTTVPPKQSQKLYDALRAKGVPAELVLYPDVGHDFTVGGNPDPSINAQAMQKVTQFLAANFPPALLAANAPLPAIAPRAANVPLAANAPPQIRRNLLN